ncbi:MAG: GtrA family protein [Mycoplasmatales bacterium]
MSKIIRFLIVGCSSFAFEMAILYFFYSILGIEAVTSNTIAFIFSLIINYFATIKFVFKVNNNKGNVINFSFFIAMGLFGIFINIIFGFVGITLLGFNVYYIKILGTIIIMIINYIAKIKFLERGKDVC